MSLKTIVIDNVTIILSHPLNSTIRWIGQSEPLRQLSACWLVVDPVDLPLTPRIVGVPGVGKTTLAMAAAQARGQNVYIMQCTSDTRPEDLIISPVLSSEGKIAYHASPLLTALIEGAVCILDEGNRMSEKSWASLAGLFDNRRSVESTVAGISISAHADFRAAVTMNEDESTFEIPDYIISRLQPGIKVGFPKRSDEQEILSYNLPFAPLEILDKCVDFLQQAHGFDLPYSLRDGISIVRYTLKQHRANPTANVQELFKAAIAQILGHEALDLEALGNRKSDMLHKTAGLGDFFFEDDDDLNPDFDVDKDGLR